MNYDFYIKIKDKKYLKIRSNNYGKFSQNALQHKEMYIQIVHHRCKLKLEWLAEVYISIGVILPFSELHRNIVWNSIMVLWY